MKLLRRAFAAGTVALGLLAPGIAHAATITVSAGATADTVASDGKCSLREAITAANSNTAANDCSAGTASADTIMVPAGTFAVTGAAGDDANSSGDLDVDLAGGPLTIQGAGAGSTILHSDGSDRVLDFIDSGDATVSGVTIEDGAVDAHGGGIRADADNDLTVTDSTVTDNNSEGDSAVEAGGGIYKADGSLTLTQDNITDNVVAFDDLAGTADGASISGGGVDIGPGMGGTAATITKTTIDGNQVNTQNNTQTVSGGGLAVTDAGGNVTLNQDTISGNRALSDGGTNQGGGTWIDGGNVSLAAITDANNVGAGDLHFDDNGMSSFQVRGSVFSDGSPCGADKPTSLGYNILASGSIGTALPTQCPFTSTGDQEAGPGLGSTVVADLEDNGGPTMTDALQTGSLAKDAIPTADCLDASGNPLTVDQRGAERPQNGACDTGAYEEATCMGQIAKVVGGPGNDVITGTSGSDSILAGGGDDTITVQGDDSVCAGPGNDTLVEAEDHFPSQIDGGPGTDTITMAGIAASSNMNVGSGVGAIDSTLTSTDLLTSVENAIGSPLPDIIIGDDGPNTLSGLGGNDTIVGGGGPDTISGGDNNDAIYVRDGVADTVDCGAGVDTVQADASGVDSLSNCEFPDFLSAGSSTTPAGTTPTTPKAKCKKKKKKGHKAVAAKKCKKKKKKK